MHFTICTIGFAGKTAEEFFRLLQQADVKKVIDIRENRTGQLSGFAKYPDFLFFLGRVAGISYEHEPTLAPTPEIRRAYRNGRDWTTYESSFRASMAQRGARQANLPPEKFPLVAKTCGNLGASTCGVALAKALDTHGKKSADARGPIFLAAVGPGMLWGWWSSLLSQLPPSHVSHD